MTKYLMILAALFGLIACGGDDPKTDPIQYTEDGWAIYAGLEWSPLAEETMIWQEAMDYCEAMGARLPTIDELRKIIINCPSSAYGGACKASDPDCLHDDCWDIDHCRCDGSANSYSALGDGENVWLWSSSSHDYLFFAWFVLFYNGWVHTYDKYNYFNVRCVR